jgi:5'-nucleotidase
MLGARTRRRYHDGCHDPSPTPPGILVSPPRLTDLLVVAISSRALFDFEEENALFDPRDDGPYIELQLTRLEQLAKPGIAFRLVKKLLGFNADGVQRVEVVILSRNDPVSGLRVMKSVQGNKLAIERAVFTRGREPWGYLRPLNANLFLSANPEDVREALHADFPVPAAVVYTRAATEDSHPDEVRIAFDGDAVLFADEAERVFRAGGLDAFQSHEADHATRPLPPGPFKPLLEALHRLQQADDRDKVPMRLRTALVTARSAPAHERAIRTLMDWRIHVDEAMFLGGLDKGPFLREFEPDFYFDDQTRYVESAAAHVPSGHVPHGIANEETVERTVPAAGVPR